MSEFADKLRTCSWADEKYLKKVNKDKNWTENYPELSRDAGAKILRMVMDSPKPLKLVDSLYFVAESWDCEWAYVVDLDLGTFEVYKGGNTEQVADDNRFKGVTSPDQDEHFPVTLVAAFDLAALPSRKDFLLTCDPERQYEYPEGFYDGADDEVEPPEVDEDESDKPVWSV